MADQPNQKDKQTEGKITPRLVPTDIVYGLFERYQPGTYFSTPYMHERLYMLAFGGDLHDKHDEVKAIAKSLAKELDGTPVMYWLSKLYEQGAIKYGEDNWKNNDVPVRFQLHAAWRHYAQHREAPWGNDEETGVPHIVACLWNIIATLWVFENRKDRL